MKKMITPLALQTKSVPMNVSGKYDWKKQAYEFDACKFGTSSRTSFGTNSGQFNFSDDSNTDSYND